MNAKVLQALWNLIQEVYLIYWTKWKCMQEDDS